jgi:hypothetical protein
MKLILSSALVSLALAGCGGEKIVLHTQPLDTADIHVTATEARIGGKKLWLKLMIQNNGSGTLIVTRDAMTAHLPNGQTLNRAVGSWTSHEPYVITPHGLHPVFVEFEQQGFEWKDVPQAQIDFTNAITKDGQPLSVPPFVVTR